MKSILIVCTGNVCRSPMAAGFIKQMLAQKNRNDIQVQSAGIMAGRGFAASEKAVVVMQEQGVDINDHRSMPLTPALIEQSDVILVMEEYHRDWIVRFVPEAENKVRLLKEFAIRTDTSMDINDPIGGSIESYRECAKEVKSCLLNFVAEYFDGKK